MWYIESKNITPGNLFKIINKNSVYNFLNIILKFYFKKLIVLQILWLNSLKHDKGIIGIVTHEEVNIYL